MFPCFLLRIPPPPATTVHPAAWEPEKARFPRAREWWCRHNPVISPDCRQIPRKQLWRCLLPVHRLRAQVEAETAVVLATEAVPEAPRREWVPDRPRLGLEEARAPTTAPVTRRLRAPAAPAI